MSWEVRGLNYEVGILILNFESLNLEIMKSFKL